jgi:hypothetical protein
MDETRGLPIPVHEFITDKYIPRNVLPFSETAPSVSSNNGIILLAKHIAQENRAATGLSLQKPESIPSRFTGHLWWEKCY